MYNVSQAYINAMRSNNRPYNTVYGLVTLTAEAAEEAGVETVTVSSSVMPSNSISISRQCIDGDELMFGGVFLGTLNLSLMTDLSRYVFYGATVELYFRVKVGETSTPPVEPIYEDVPLGIYVVSDADRPQNVVKLTAYDNMRMLDMDLGDTVLQGKAWLVFQQIQTATGMELAFEEADLADFVNKDIPMQLDKTRGCNTYRDAVKSVCQLLGCFAQADRTGKLEVRRFGMTSVQTLTRSHWYSLLPADYMCNYVKLSVTGMAGTFTSQSIGAQGNTMIIEDAPAWDYGLEETLQGQTDDLFEYLSEIDYTPCELDMPSDPAFDCGDRLTLVTNKGNISTLITSYEWKWHNGMSIESEGVNPYLTGASSQEYGNRIINNDIKDSEVQFYHFTNPADIAINDGDEAIVIGSIKFSATKKTSAMFVATILVNIDVDDITHTSEEELEVPIKLYNIDGEEITLDDEEGNPITFLGTTVSTHEYKRDGKCKVKIYYSLNGNVYPYMAIDKLSAGEHIISVEYPITGLDTQTLYTWNVYMLSDGGAISMSRETLRATVFGQGLMEADIWDGNIEISDDVTRYAVGILTPRQFEDSAVEVTKFCTSDDPEYDNEHLLVKETLTDTVTRQDVGTLTITEMTDSLSIVLENIVYNLVTEDGLYNIVAEEMVGDQYVYNITTEGDE